MTLNKKALYKTLLLMIGVIIITTMGTIYPRLFNYFISLMILIGVSLIVYKHIDHEEKRNE